jgi:predicted nucleotidyltransferase
MKQPDKGKSEILHIIQQLFQGLSEKYSVKRIGIFGSYAKENHDNNSDVDILVELEEPTFDHYMDLKFRLEEVLNRPVDLVMADTIKPRLKHAIEQEVIYA